MMEIFTLVAYGAMINPLTDRKFRLPRLWSNQEIRKFAHLFEGDVVNVSAWKDVDKEGRTYRDYFYNAKSYSITNYEADARGFQGQEGEIFLDLEKDLDPILEQKFDLVFNHTTLEHVFYVQKAFENLCKLSKDAVMVVVPFLQEMHTDYGDYWRLTPQALERLFADNGFIMRYVSFNSHTSSSVYIFCIGVRNEQKWEGKIPRQVSSFEPKPVYPISNQVGAHAVINIPFQIRRMISSLVYGKKRKKY